MHETASNAVFVMCAGPIVGVAVVATDVRRNIRRLRFLRGHGLAGQAPFGVPDEHRNSFVAEIAAGNQASVDQHALERVVKRDVDRRRIGPEHIEGFTSDDPPMS